MHRLDRVVTKAGASGHPLPTVFKKFEEAQVSFRAGEVAMIAGQPGAGKSAVALWLATQWVSKHGQRGIYFSADSSELVQAGRALAMVSHGIDTKLAEERLEAGDETSIGLLYSRLDGLGWCFDPDITYESIEQEVLAFQELWGSMPDFIVIDNLTDVEGQSEDEWAAMRRVMKNLVILARETGSHVLVLHHSTEDAKEEPCPPRKALMGKVAQKQSLVLTIGEGDARSKPIAVVKNRYGAADKTGRTAMYFPYDKRTFHFGGAA